MRIWSSPEAMYALICLIVVPLPLMVIGIAQILRGRVGRRWIVVTLALTVPITVAACAAAAVVTR